MPPAILFEDDSSENGGDHEADAPTRPDKVDRINTHLDDDCHHHGDHGQDDDDKENGHILPQHFWPGRVALDQRCLRPSNSYSKVEILPSANPRPMWPDQARGKKMRQKSFSFSSITLAPSANIAGPVAILNVIVDQYSWEHLRSGAATI